MSNYQPIFDIYNKQFESLTLNANNVEVLSVSQELGDTHNTLVVLRVDRAINAEGDVDPVMEASEDRYSVRHVEVERFELFDVATEALRDALSAAIAAVTDVVIEDGKFSKASIQEVITNEDLRAIVIFLESDIDIVPITIDEEEQYVVVAKRDSLGFLGRITVGKLEADPEPEVPIEELDWISETHVVNIISITPPVTEPITDGEVRTIQYTNESGVELRARFGLRAAAEDPDPDVLGNPTVHRIKKGSGKLNYTYPAGLGLPEGFIIAVEIIGADDVITGHHVGDFQVKAPPPPEYVTKDAILNSDLGIVGIAPDLDSTEFSPSEKITLTLGWYYHYTIYNITYGVYYNGAMIDKFVLPAYLTDAGGALILDIPDVSRAPDIDTVEYRLIDPATSKPSDVPFAIAKLAPPPEPQIPIDQLPWVTDIYGLSFERSIPLHTNSYFAAGDNVYLRFYGRAEEQRAQFAVITQSDKAFILGDPVRLEKAGTMTEIVIPSDYHYYSGEQLYLVLVVDGVPDLSGWFAFLNMYGDEAPDEFITVDELTNLVVNPNNSHVNSSGAYSGNSLAFTHSGTASIRRKVTAQLEFVDAGWSTEPNTLAYDFRRDVVHYRPIYDQSMPVGLESRVKLYFGGEDFEATKRVVAEFTYNSDPTMWTNVLQDIVPVKVTSSGAAEAIPSAASGDDIELHFNSNSMSTTYAWIGIPELNFWYADSFNYGSTVSPVKVPAITSDKNLKFVLANEDKSIILPLDFVELIKDAT